MAGLLVLSACASSHAIVADVPPGLHRRAGDEYFQTREHAGIPILQKSFAWDGNGETENYGAGLHWFHCVADDFAMGAGMNLTSWLLPGTEALGAEIESVARWYPRGDWPLFVDLTGGFQQSTTGVPYGGTEWNFSFGFGPGLDFPVGEQTSLLLAADYHHISNALGRQNDRNPSQNDARLWIGLAWSF